MKVSKTNGAQNGASSSSFTEQFNIDMIMDVLAISTGLIITTAFFSLFGGEA